MVDSYTCMQVVRRTIEPEAHRILLYSFLLSPLSTILFSLIGPSDIASLIVRNRRQLELTFDRFASTLASAFPLASTKCDCEGPAIALKPNRSTNAVWAHIRGFITNAAFHTGLDLPLLGLAHSSHRDLPPNFPQSYCCNHRKV